MLETQMIVYESRREAIVAASRYLTAKRNQSPSTVVYKYKKTYNYILSKMLNRCCE